MLTVGISFIQSMHSSSNKRMNAQSLHVQLGPMSHTRNNGNTFGCRYYGDTSSTTTTTTTTIRGFKQVTYHSGSTVTSKMVTNLRNRRDLFLRSTAKISKYKWQQCNETRLIIRKWNNSSSFPVFRGRFNMMVCHLFQFKQY